MQHHHHHHQHHHHHFQKNAPKLDKIAVKIKRSLQGSSVENTHPNSEHFFFVVGFVLLLLLVVVAALLLLLLVVQGQVKVSRVNKIQLTRINWKIKYILSGLVTRRLYFLEKSATFWAKFPSWGTWPICSIQIDWRICKVHCGQGYTSDESIQPPRRRERRVDRVSWAWIITSGVSGGWNISSSVVLFSIHVDDL